MRSELEKNVLKKSIDKYLFPYEDKKIKEKWRIVYDRMIEDDVLPDTISNEYSLRRVWIRIEESKIDQYDIVPLIRPMIKQKKVTDQVRFLLYWTDLTEKGKHEFMNWLGQTVLLKGIPPFDVCHVIGTELERVGFLSKQTVTRYIKKEFKNFEMSKRRKGRQNSRTNLRTMIGMKNRKTAV